MELQSSSVPVTEIFSNGKVSLFLKREDLIHPQISGNKYWKLLYNIKDYLQENISAEKRLISTFGGAFSNHIAAVAALGKEMRIPTIGIIRGEELSDKFNQNPTLSQAFQNGMSFRFVSREAYQDKNALSLQLEKDFPELLIIPEGGTNQKAVDGVKHMLTNASLEFDYLCSAAGTGGTLAGLSKYAAEHQKVVGFSVVKDKSLQSTITKLSNRDNFEIIEADFGGYGKISDEVVRFVNNFRRTFSIPLDPVYTGKMMMKLFAKIEEGYFPEGSRILAFHTGGLQGIEGANLYLKRKKRILIDI